MADIDKYDTNCPYNNKPCVGCGSFFTECPRYKVENEEVELDASNRICQYTRAECCNRNFYREGCENCSVEHEWRDKVARGEVEPFKCPHTGKPCKDWDCLNCEIDKEVEEKVVEWMKKMEESEDDYGNTTETT